MQKYQSVGRTARLAPRRRFTRLASALALAALPAGFASAAVTRTWTGLGADNAWSTAQNWAGNVAPAESTAASGDVAFEFGGTARTTSSLTSATTGLNGGFNTASITFLPTATSSFLVNETGGSRGLDMLGATRNQSERALITNNSTAAHTLAINLVVRGDNSAGLEFDTASGNLTASGVISSSGSIIARMGIYKSGPNTLTISHGSNSYTGPTTVAAGTLAISGAGRLGSATNAQLVAVATGAVLDLSAATVTSGVTNAISNSATLSLAGGGTPDLADSGHIVLPDDATEVVESLVLGGVAQPAGTYGSSASAATFKFDEYFSGTGVISVVPVPEPGMAALLGVAAATMLRRRGR